MLSLFLGVSAQEQAAPAPCRVHVILFLPASVQPPDGYQQRINEIVDYSEAFLRRGMDRWGLRDVVMPFCRTADGDVEVRVFRGAQKLDDYKPVTLRAEVMDALRAEGRINVQKQVWWILVYAGEQGAGADGVFLGGFGEQIGGWATCNLDMSPGRISPREPMGSDFLVKLMLKGMLHELGHGFGLPHIGPIDADRAGNTLMGATHVNWRRVRGEGDRRVYLSEAAAAVLARHPAFRGVPDDRGRLPAFSLEGLECVVEQRQRRFVVTGTVKSDEPAAYALVADESEALPGEYWTKTYVGKVDEDGSFRVVVSEPAAAGGTLRIWFVFEDGDHTGDGRQRSRPSGIARSYTFDNGRWSFE